MAAPPQHRCCSGIFALLPPDTHTPARAAARARARPTLAPSLQVFGARTAIASGPRHATHPVPTLRSILQVTDGSDIDPVSLEAAGGVPPYRWVINGTMLPAPPVGMSMLWQPEGPGFAHISVLDARDNAISENIELH